MEETDRGEGDEAVVEGVQPVPAGLQPVQRGGGTQQEHNQDQQDHLKIIAVDKWREPTGTQPGSAGSPHDNNIR